MKYAIILLNARAGRFFSRPAFARLFSHKHGQIDFAAEMLYIIRIFMKKNKIDAEEFRVLLDEFSKSIRESVARYGLEKRGIDSEDVIQEVKIKIWKKLAREKEIHFRSLYIKRMVNSTLIDHIRRIRRQEKLISHEKERLLQEERGNARNPDEEDYLWKQVGEAQDSLLESRRKVVKLFLMDLTIDEISIVLKWSKDKTRNLLYRGLSDLKEKLKERGIEYENRH